MIATDIFKPDEWHDFFVAAAGVGAVLAGLVFVAMSINLDVFAQNATHRCRAMNVLTGFTAALLICLLALVGGQNHQAVGTEWLVVTTATTVFCVRNYVQAAKMGGIRTELRPDRMAVGVACYVAEIVGAVVLRQIAPVVR
jgi:hypothetical protein